MNSSSTTTQILLVEDNPSDALLVKSLLTDTSNGSFAVNNVSNLSQTIHELKHWRFHAILLDLGLPDSSGIDVVSQVSRHAPDTPIVVLTGIEDEQTALKAVQRGAQDFLVKGEFDAHLLTRSIRYAVERARLEQDRNKLASQLLESISNEQHRIGRELHDGVGQILGGLNLISNSTAQKLKDRDIPEAADLNLISEGIHNVLGEFRTILRGLNPVDVDQHGLNIALEHLCEATEQRCKIACPYTADNTVVQDLNVATHLYRIAQESINNAVKHAQAKKIEVQLVHQDDDIELLIRDDGIGFQVDAEDSGMGLRILKHRAFLINAHITIESEVGEGTTVTCAFTQKRPHE